MVVACRGRYDFGISEHGAVGVLNTLLPSKVGAAASGGESDEQAGLKSVLKWTAGTDCGWRRRRRRRAKFDRCAATAAALDMLQFLLRNNVFDWSTADTQAREASGNQATTFLSLLLHHACGLGGDDNDGDAGAGDEGLLSRCTRMLLASSSSSSSPSRGQSAQPKQRLAFVSAHDPVALSLFGFMEAAVRGCNADGM